MERREGAQACSRWANERLAGHVWQERDRRLSLATPMPWTRPPRCSAVTMGRRSFARCCILVLPLTVAVLFGSAACTSFSSDAAPDASPDAAGDALPAPLDGPVAGDGAAESSPDAGPAWRYAFVTSGTRQGNMTPRAGGSNGGRSAADAWCKELAESSGRPNVLGRRWRAWLSEIASSANSRFPPSIRMAEYRTVDDHVVFATGFPNNPLVLAIPLGIDEEGGSCKVSCVR